jgi:hypothetical protein
MAHGDEFASPVMGTAACFHGDYTGLAVRKKLSYLMASQLTSMNLTSFDINPMQLKNVLCQIKANYCTVHCHSSLPWVMVSSPLWHFDTEGNNEGFCFTSLYYLPR